MEKITIVIVCMLLIGTFFAIVPDAVSADQDGDYTFTVSNGKAIITGYTGNGGAIKIPATMTDMTNESILYPTVAIADRAFQQKNSLTSVIIPDSVTWIGNFSFYSCRSLTSVTIGTGFTQGYRHCFESCSALMSINFLQTSMPFDLCSCWLEYTSPDLRGHAYSNSQIARNYPPGVYWPDANLTMGTYIGSPSNNPPIISSPSPGNGTTENLLSLSWSISINDPDGDRFSWTIQCSNGQSNSGTGASNGRKSLALSNLEYSTVYRVWVNATDPSGSNTWTRRWYRFTTIEITGNPPVFGSPSPANSSTTNPISLTWNIPINDLEGDTFSWTIQCNNTQKNNGTMETNGTKTLSLTGLEYSESYTIWVNATDPTGTGQYTRQWFTFRTKAKPVSPPPPPPPPDNEIPIADLSAGEPYQGFVNTAITFNGSKSSDSDGTITTWSWNFGDNTSGTGTTVTHTFSQAGIYTVSLTVTDNDGATHTDTTTCVITRLNRPPTTPIITGPTHGTKNTMYTFAAVSTDVDNDTIQYSISWGDVSSYVNTSAFLPNNTQFTCGHQWTIPGIYTIRVKAFDNTTDSLFAHHVILIDVEYVEDLGYLINMTGNSDYEMFYSNATKNKTNVQKQANGSYLIDNDGNGTWDYTFDPIIKGLTRYQEPKTPGFELTFVLCAIAIALFLWRKKRN